MSTIRLLFIHGKDIKNLPTKEVRELFLSFQISSQRTDAIERLNHRDFDFVVFHVSSLSKLELNVYCRSLQLVSVQNFWVIFLQEAQHLILGTDSPCLQHTLYLKESDFYQKISLLMKWKEKENLHPTLEMSLLASDQLRFAFFDFLVMLKGESVQFILDDYNFLSELTNFKLRSFQCSFVNRKVQKIETHFIFLPQETIDQILSFEYFVSNKQIEGEQLQAIFRTMALKMNKDQLTMIPDFGQEVNSMPSHPFYVITLIQSPSGKWFLAHALEV